MRNICVFIFVFIAGCTSSQKTYDQSVANELAVKREPIFQQPSYISMPVGTGTPYSTQTLWHDAVKTTLNLLVDENPNYAFCVGNREARIGVLNAKLPKCKTRNDQEKAGVRPVLIGMIDYVEGHTTQLYIQVLPVSVINPEEGSLGYRSGMAYACIRLIFSYTLLDTNVWQSNSNTIHPLKDNACVKEPIENIILGSN